MKITEVELLEANLRKDDPAWHFALGGTPASNGYIVRLVGSEGIDGYGSCAAATYYGLSLGGLRAALELFVPLLVGRDPTDLEPILSDLDHALSGHERAKAAIEIALHDLNARTFEVPLFALLGGLVRSSVPVVRILGLNPPAKVAQRAETLVNEGFRYLKIKLDGDVETDVARVRAVRERVGPDIHLTADANQSYVVKTAIRALRAMQPLGLELIEQPVHAEDVDGLRRVRNAVDVLVEADESAHTLEAIANLIHCEAVDSINLKIAHVGGLRKAKIAAGLCRAAGVNCRVSSTVGSQIISAATVHFFASTPGLADPSEVGEWARLRDDPASGLKVENGMIPVPLGHGLGVSVDQAKIDRM